MRRRTKGGSAAADPVLVGAVTVLIAAIAVFLSFNANAGLPFVPTYTVHAQAPSAKNLIKGADVRLGGTRIGIVHGIEPVRHAGGAVTARIDLRLDTSVRPLPADSTVLIRSRSSLGGEYLQVTRGRSARGVPDGGSLALSQAMPRTVELDEVLNAFDVPTRRATQVGIRELGDALAGRGGDVNAALSGLDPLLRRLTPVMANLAAPETGLRGLVRSLGRLTAVVAPAAGAEGALVRDLDTTLGALAVVSRPQLQDAIARAPRTLDVATRELPGVRPFLANAKGLFADLRPGVHALRRAAPDLADALVAGTPALRRSTALSRRLKPAFAALLRFAEDPLVALGVADLTETVSVANPTLAHLTPAQTVCNYATLFFRNVASLLSEPSAAGTAQRFAIIVTPQGPDNEGGPAAAPANGPRADNYLHSNPYPNTAAPGQPRECEAANEGYASGRQAIGNVPGSQGTAHDVTKGTG